MSRFLRDNSKEVQKFKKFKKVRGINIFLGKGLYYAVLVVPWPEEGGEKVGGLDYKWATWDTWPGAPPPAFRCCEFV